MTTAESPQHNPYIEKVEQWGGYTHLGTALGQHQSTWGYSATDLLRTGVVNKTDLETISRVSHDEDFISSMRPKTQTALVGKIADAVTTYVARGYVWEDKAEGFKTRLLEQLKSAIERDKRASMERPLAVVIAKKLGEITGASHLRLVVAIEEAKSIEEFLENLGNLPPKEQ